MIQYQIEKLPELRRKFDPKIVEQSLQRALQLAATKTRTRISKEVRVTYNIKAGAIGKNVALRRLPEGRLLLYTGPLIGLDKFGARGKNVKTAHGKRRGVTVQVKKTAARKLVKGGFVGGKGKVIFKRTGESRLPIKRLFGPAIAQMVANQAVIDDALLLTGEDMAVEFNRQMEVHLGRPA
jgi:hypothetical protein